MIPKRIHARFSALGFLLSVALVVALLGVATNSQEPPPGDIEARAILDRMGLATGWASSQLPADAQATGTITLYRGGQEYTYDITLGARGQSQLRMDFQGDSQVFNGAAGATTSQGVTRRVPGHVADARRPFELPFMVPLLQQPASGTKISFEGVETIDGESTDKITITPQLVDAGEMRPYLERTKRISIWISLSTHLPVLVEYNRIAFNNPYAANPVRVKFSDYQVAGGIAVPRRMEETRQGRPRRTIQISNIEFNVGLTDADFTVPGAGQ